MTLANYQFAAFSTALPSSKTHDYMALGLAGEAGEVANKVKKITRDGHTPALRVAILAELGDVLWYVAGLATVLGADLSEIAQENLAKLGSRSERDVIKGAGDER